MLNVISIDSLDNCKCNLISNTNDGSNKVILQISADVLKNPQLEINSMSIPITSNNFEYEIDSKLYVGSDLLKFRIIDNDHTGEYFQIQKITSLNGNLFLKQKSNFAYVLVVFNSDATKDQISVKVGDTKTLPAGYDAIVTNSGDEKNVVLNFSIPQGKDGDTPQMMINADGHLIAIYN